MLITVIEDELTNLKALSKAELPNSFNNILQQINNLEKRLTKATAFIPSYDERQFSLVSCQRFFTNMATIDRFDIATERVERDTGTKQSRIDTQSQVFI